MAKYAWNLRNGRLIYRHQTEATDAQRSSFPCPMLALDTMDPVQSMVDGKTYDSKSSLRGTYKAAGVTEVGNDPARLRPREKPKSDPVATKQAVEKATARFARGERAA